MPWLVWESETVEQQSGSVCVRNRSFGRRTQESPAVICKHHRPAASNEIQTEPVVLNKAYLCETYFYYEHWHDNKETGISKVILSIWWWRSNKWWREDMRSHVLFVEWKHSVESGSDRTLAWEDKQEEDWDIKRREGDLHLASYSNAKKQELLWYEETQRWLSADHRRMFDFDSLWIVKLYIVCIWAQNESLCK